MFHQALCIISKPSVNLNWRYNPEAPNLGQNQRLFVPCDLEIWWITLKNNKAPFLSYFKLCVLFRSHQSIENGVAVRKSPIRVKIGDFLSHVTLKFDGWPWKSIGHLFYVSSSFVHHLVAIYEFKLESENAKIGTKFVLTSVTLTFDLDLLHGHHFCWW